MSGDPNSGQPPGPAGSPGSSPGPGPSPSPGQPAAGGSSAQPALGHPASGPSGSGAGADSGNQGGTGGATGIPDPGQPLAPGGRRGPTSGRTYAEAASQVGGNLSEENREHIRALADLRGGQVGDVVMGSKFELAFGQGPTRIRARRITAEEFSAPFVRTPELSRLAASISDQPLIVLQGPRGYGKAAALVWTLRRDLPDGAKMFYLDPATDLAAFSCEGVPEDSVLILQDLPDSAADSLDPYAVGRIQSELRTRRCRLGITVSKAANLTALSTDFLVIEFDARPDPHRVFNRHLSELLIGTDLTPDTVRNWPDVAALVDVHLGPDCSLADAARLATLLLRAREHPDAAAARVQTQMTEYADEKVALWFRKLSSLKVQCMAISLAVLNGQSREMIAREARLLETSILPAPDAPNAPAPVNPFGVDAAISPALLQARVVTETRMTKRGPIAIRAMSYQEPGYPGQVLRYVWREHDDARPALVDWLRHLGASPELAVRVRAATAVGVLACEAMDHLYSQIILGWASDDDADVRASAAIALGPPATDPLVRDTVRSVVANWAKKDSGAWQLRATAARAYGQSIGLSSPSRALRELARLAEVDDLALVIAIANSYCELMVDGTAPLSARVIGEIQKLADDRVREKQLAGRLSLLGLSYQRGAPLALSEQASRIRDWPTLLVLATNTPGIAASTARLWQLSLSDPSIGSLVTASLDDWAEAVEDVSELRTALVDLMHTVAADERARRAVLRRAQLWTGRDGKAPKTGQSVIEDLG